MIQIVSSKSLKNIYLKFDQINIFTSKFYFLKRMAQVEPVEPKILSRKKIQTLEILRNIVKDEGNPPVINKPDFSTIGYPVLIGSRSVKWHIPSFREPNDWDFIATASQSILFINMVTKTKRINLTHY